MHPAVSVIFFTVLSGAGFGFMALIGLGVPMPAGGAGAFTASLFAGGLAVAGLLSSTFHLGHPERAWRALTQWRSSWLSREGICAILTLVAFGLYALFWVFSGERIAWLGWLVTAGSVLTVFTTAMIYTQLKTVPRWNTWMTPPCYLLFATLSGCLLAAAFGYWSNAGRYTTAGLIVALVVVAWAMKLFWWLDASNRTLKGRGSDTGTATGLGNIGKVKLFERPHSGENYLTREMVHKIGRKHAAKLKVIALIFGALIPLLCCVLVLGSGFNQKYQAVAMVNSALYSVSFLSLMAGLFVERWLFFAEAEHAVSLYYD